VQEYRLGGLDPAEKEEVTKGGVIYGRQLKVHRCINLPFIPKMR
jgi:hypothetical protein